MPTTSEYRHCEVTILKEPAERCSARGPYKSGSICLHISSSRAIPFFYSSSISTATIQEAPEQDSLRSSEAPTRGGEVARHPFLRREPCEREEVYRGAPPRFHKCNTDCTVSGILQCISHVSTRSRCTREMTGGCNPCPGRAQAGSLVMDLHGRARALSRSTVSQ